MLVKALKALLILVLLLAAVLVVGGFVLSPKFSVSRSVVIGAPADKVYALLASPRAWQQWSVWHRRDPGMAITYRGPESGAGAGWEWKSKSEGDGRMDFTAAEPARRIAYDLYFPDFGTTSTGELRLRPVTETAGTRTEVTWTMNGDMGKNPLFRWMALMADGMVGKDFAAGLANLKAVAEQP